MSCEWHDKIFTVSGGNFAELTLEIFRFQYHTNHVYRAFVDALGTDPGTIQSADQIPFLPISFFKTDKIKSGEFNPDVIFESSGTTTTLNSRHYVKDQSIYRESFTRGFQNIYGKINDWAILGLLPNYLEKGNSSLVFMVENLIKASGHEQSGFYLNDLGKLSKTISLLERQKQKTLLIGVTYALLDFAEQFPTSLATTTIMETGGMKGRKEELTRMEVHARLKSAFGQTEIHSEYGMTELLSQAYAVKDGIFRCPSWMKIMIRDEEDPLSVRSSELGASSNEITHHPSPITGAINIIDLANIYSCSFIATDDIGKLYADGSFEVLGRMDGSDLRGCSLLTV